MAIGFRLLPPATTGQAPEGSKKTNPEESKAAMDE